LGFFWWQRVLLHGQSVGATSMKVGDLVKTKQKSVLTPDLWDGRGIIIEVKTNKSKWVKIACSDGVMITEHIDDLEIINESR
jgi:hypothetical protein